MQIFIDPTLLKMPQVRSITGKICDGETFFPSSGAVSNDESWTLAWGYPVTKRCYGVAETGFFWDGIHIDTQGLYQFSSLNTYDAYRQIQEYSPPKSAIELINKVSLPKSKYRQPQEKIEWNGVVFACQNPSDRSIHSVASTEDWWRFYEESCRYYGSRLFVKLHPWNRNEIEVRIREIAGRFNCRVGKAGHSLLENCEHVVLFNSTFSVDCMLKGKPILQGAPGYFSGTGAVTYCAGDPRKKLEDTKESAKRLLNFLVWRYCFSMDCTLEDWKRRLHIFASSRETFPLPLEESYGHFLNEKICSITSKDSNESKNLGMHTSIRKSSSREPSCSRISRPLISFCTTCKGRLHHLKQTLPRNLEQNSLFFPHIEFILLDYDSQDGLENWAQEHLSDYIASGLLKYYKTGRYEFYHSAHAKNISHLLSSGEILCNLDADTYLKPSMVLNIWEEFAKHPETIMHGAKRSTHGRMVLQRDHFLSLGGYCENMRGYGHADGDLLDRSKNKFQLREIVAGKYDEFINHSHAERTKHYEFNSIHESNKINGAIRKNNSRTQTYVVNEGSEWGAALVKRNFSQNATFISSKKCRFSAAERSSVICPYDRGVETIEESTKTSPLDHGLMESLRVVIPSDETVIDFGTRRGSYIKHLSQLGFKCLGVDGTPGLKSIADFDSIVTKDFTESVLFDWPPSTVLCLEVLGQIPECYEDQVIQNLLNNCSGILILSWARPGQAGKRLVNTRKSSYVENLMKKRGMILDNVATKFLRESSKLPWFSNNILVFRKAEK